MISLSLQYTLFYPIAFLKIFKCCSVIIDLSGRISHWIEINDPVSISETPACSLYESLVNILHVDLFGLVLLRFISVMNQLLKIHKAPILFIVLCCSWASRTVYDCFSPNEGNIMDRYCDTDRYNDYYIIKYGKVVRVTALVVTGEGTLKLAFNVSSDDQGSQPDDVFHYCDVIMSAMASQITGVSIVYSAVCSVADQIKNQSSTSLAVVRGNHQWPVNSPHKGPVTRKMFPFDDVIMVYIYSVWCVEFNLYRSSQAAHWGHSEHVLILTSIRKSEVAKRPVVFPKDNDSNQMTSEGLRTRIWAR